MCLVAFQTLFFAGDTAYHTSTHSPVGANDLHTVATFRLLGLAILRRLASGMFPSDSRIGFLEWYHRINWCDCRTMRIEGGITVVEDEGG